MALGVALAVGALAVAAAAAGLDASPAPGSASVDAATLEGNVQAVFVTKFPLFVEWPDGAFRDAAAPFELCVLGDAPFGGEVESAAERQRIHDRSVTVRRLTEPVDLQSCRVLFIGRSEAVRVDAILRDVAAAGVLTVSAIEGFTRAGGVIGFLRRDGRVAFEINLPAAAGARLTISSQLLKLAVSVSER